MACKTRERPHTMASSEPVEISIDIVQSILGETDRLYVEHGVSNWMFAGILNGSIYRLTKFLLMAPYKRIDYDEELNEINRTIQLLDCNDIFICKKLTNYNIEINGELIKVKRCFGVYHISKYGQKHEKKILFYISVPYKSRFMVLALESQSMPFSFSTRYEISELFKKPNQCQSNQ